MDFSCFCDTSILDAANMYAQSNENSLEINDCLLDSSLDMDMSLVDLPVGPLLDNFWKDLNAQNDSSLNQAVLSNTSLSADLPESPSFSGRSYQLEGDCDLFTTNSGGNVSYVIPEINEENIYDNMYVEVDSSNMGEDINVLLGVEKKKQSSKSGKQRSGRKLSQASTRQMSQGGRKNKRTSNDEDQFGCPVNVTEEERRLLAESGVILPECYPLSRKEETELKRIRRKLRNKEAARESRRRKKQETRGLRERLAETEKALKILQTGMKNENEVLVRENTPMETLQSLGKSILEKATISRSASVDEDKEGVKVDSTEPGRTIGKMNNNTKMSQSEMNRENGETVGKSKEHQHHFGCVLALVLLTVMVMSSSVKKACPGNVNFHGLQDLQMNLQYLNASFSHHPCNTADEIQAILLLVRKAVIYDQLLVSSIADMVGVPVSDVVVDALHDHNYFGSKGMYKLRPTPGVERKKERVGIVVDESRSSTSDESAYSSDMEWSEVGKSGSKRS